MRKMLEARKKCDRMNLRSGPRLGTGREGSTQKMGAPEEVNQTEERTNTDAVNSRKKILIIKNKDLK